MPQSLLFAAPHPNSRSLRIQFEWHGDRFAHRIELLDGERPVTLLQSAEGRPDDLGPPSPPLQQLHIEDRSAESRVALAVGMAGRNHWSLSVEMGPGGGSLDFDVACRVSAAGVGLGSQYELPTAPSLALAPQRCCSPALGWELTVPAESATRLVRLADRLHISGHSPAAIPGTVRWRYQLRVTDAEMGKKGTADDR